MLLRARRLGLIASAASLAAGLMTVVAPAAVASTNPSGQTNPYSPAYGHPYRHGVVPTTSQQRKMKSWNVSAAPSCNYPPSTSSCGLSYGGGIDGTGVTSGPPKVYLVFWGSQWGTQGTDSNGYMTFSKDYASGAPYIQAMFKGLGTGGELWSGAMTQYCDGAGVATGATKCPASAQHVGYPTAGVLAGVWYDGSTAAPGAATEDQLAQEGINAAGHFGNTTQALNRYAQYFVLSAPGTNPDNYMTSGFCAWHDYNGDPGLTGGPVASPYGDVAFTNMPYVMDVSGTGCGTGFVNSPGTLDGYSIVGGHEYAETITDQNPAGGWSNPTTLEENADDCAWIPPGSAGGAADVTLATGLFAMQSTWSNDTNQCSISHPVLPYSMAANSGDQQSAVVGHVYTSSLQVTMTDSLGNPLAGLAVTFTAPTSGATVNFASPCSGSTSCMVTTNSSGVATSPTFTAAGAAGPVTITTSAYGVPSPPSFTLDNLSGAPALMPISSGNQQSATVGTPYSQPLIVKVTDSVGDPSSGVTVTFSAPSSGPSVTFASCSSNPQPYQCVTSTAANGLATASVMTANHISGPVTISATSSVTTDNFTLTNLAGSPAAASVVSGGAQQALAAGRFATPLRAHVLDGYGNPVAGGLVTFTAPASGPTATFGPCMANPSAHQCVVAIDSAGNATSSVMTAGPNPGAFNVQAVVSGAPAVQFAETVAQSGYWTVASDGGIFSFGEAPFGGSEGGKPLNKPIVGMAVAPGGGYYMVASDGGVFAFGGATFYGSQGGHPLNKPIVGMAAVPGGYYLVASDGGIFSFGSGATFYGSEGGQPLNKPIVGMAAVPGGYYLVASDGGIFSFGSGATFYGSEGGQPLNKPIVGMSAAPGGGYYMVASDGGIFTFGPGAVFQGSMGGHPLNKPIVGMSVDPATGGYWLDASDGGIFAFNAPFYGSMGGTPLNQPMVGMAPSALMPG